MAQKQELIFFTLNDFNKDAGESVRIYGIVNGLIAAGENVTLISNATDYKMFKAGINHVNLGFAFKHKKGFQASLGLLPAGIVYSLYKPLFKKIITALEAAGAIHKEVFFFDYLDNSIGYLLKEKKLIAGYINDIHGIANLEFEANIRNAINIKSRIINTAKLFLSKRLDRKVFSNAAGFIFGSNAMDKYFSGLYPIQSAKRYIIPYVLDDKTTEQKIAPALKKALEEQYHIQQTDFVILFIGTYKNTSGVDNLISVFDKLCDLHRHLKLILVGDGPMKPKCDQLIAAGKWKEKIYTIDRIAYGDIVTYQSIAHVVVCPDDQNDFSEMIVHVKYFDALLSGKVVLNGSFSSVTEINVNDSLSVSFTPSSAASLFEKLHAIIENYSFYQDKYAHTRRYTIANLTYEKFITPLITAEHKNQ